VRRALGSLSMSISRILLAIYACALAGCAGSSPMASAPVAADAAVHDWNRDLVRASLPATGCFVASYPAIAWSRVACETTAHVRPSVLGDGVDYALSVSPHLISTAIGSFPEVTGVTRVSSVPIHKFGQRCICGEGAYSLQINANFFQSSACGKNANCLAWSQLGFLNPSREHGKIAQLFIQDWLVNTSTTPGSRLTCPKIKGWAPGGFGDCFYTSPVVNIPKISAAQLDKVTASMSASPTGDSVFLSFGTTVYGMKDIQGNFMQLAQHWTSAEFNVFGDGGYSRAVFNPGSKLTVSLEADDGETAAPDCQTNAGTTGETTAMSFIAAPLKPQQQRYPSILFSESNTAGGRSPSCDSLSAL
jgi:hypothetical protein